MSGIIKLMKGILDYRQTLRPTMMEMVSKLDANPQPPKAIILSCMDSRISVSRYMGLEAGDAFIMRNGGNLFPHSDLFSLDTPSTEPAGIELACTVQGVRNIIIIGHSDCRAMIALLALKGKPQSADSPLQAWICRCGACSFKRLQELEAKGFGSKLVFKKGPTTDMEAYIDPENKFDLGDKLSQVNVLQQFENVSSHSFINDHLVNNKVKMHALWFDIHSGEFYLFREKEKRFIIIDDNSFKKFFIDV